MRDRRGGFQSSALETATRSRPGERARHLEPCAVHTTLRRRQRDVEDGGHVLVRPALDVAKNEWGTRIERKRAHLGEQSGDFLMLPRHDVGRERARRARFGTETSLARLLECLRDRSPSPVSLQRLVDGDPVEPGEGSRVAAEAVEMPPRLHERVLRRFLDVTLVVEQAAEHTSDAALEDADELLEGAEIACLRTPEERRFRFRHREDATKGL